jgi:hypothetical protein
MSTSLTFPGAYSHFRDFLSLFLLLFSETSRSEHIDHATADAFEKLISDLETLLCRKRLSRGWGQAASLSADTIELASSFGKLEFHIVLTHHYPLEIHGILLLVVSFNFFPLLFSFEMEFLLLCLLFLITPL